MASNAPEPHPQDPTRPPHDPTRRPDDPTRRPHDPSRLSRRSLLGAAAAGGALSGLGRVVPSALASSIAPAPAPPPAPARADARHREFWLSVEAFEQNLVPTGFDQMMGTTVGGASFAALGFRGYTPGFGRLLPQDESPTGIGLNSGIPGPLLRARVGDRVTVHLRNNDHEFKWPHSFHVHGWRYGPESDGSWTYGTRADAVGDGAAVPYGETYAYQYTVPETAVGTWPYHDHSVPQIYPGADPDVANPMEMNAQLGLFGIIAVTDAHTPVVDREFYLFFHDLYQDDVPVLSQDFDCFNGHAYLGNTPVFSARVGERVRWRIAALGKEFHVFHLHGHRWFNGIYHTDSQIIGPSTTATIEYTEDNAGDWLYHCHVTDHMQGGMMGRYEVTR
ncbi:MAG TPA: multicopper oxidase domain-containing protein [Solirubrobacteraceae bacterium]|nr:multicopper oxidase domain-containing protein [Solirubrobacteraceae bacterium]